MPFIVWQYNRQVYRSYASKGRLIDPSEVKAANAVDRFLKRRIPRMERLTCQLSVVLALLLIHSSFVTITWRLFVVSLVS